MGGTAARWKECICGSALARSILVYLTKRCVSEDYPPCLPIRRLGRREALLQAFGGLADLCVSFSLGAFRREVRPEAFHVRQICTVGAFGTVPAAGCTGSQRLLAAWICHAISS